MNMGQVYHFRSNVLDNKLLKYNQILINGNILKVEKDYSSIECTKYLISSIFLIENKILPLIGHYIRLL